MFQNYTIFSKFVKTLIFNELPPQLVDTLAELRQEYTSNCSSIQVARRSLKSNIAKYDDVYTNNHHKISIRREQKRRLKISTAILVQTFTEMLKLLWFITQIDLILTNNKFITCNYFQQLFQIKLSQPKAL